MSPSSRVATITPQAEIRAESDPCFFLSVKRQQRRDVGVVMVPVMKVRRNSRLADEHREADRGLAPAQALVAKGISTRKASNVPKARAAPDSEWKKL